MVNVETTKDIPINFCLKGILGCTSGRSAAKEMHVFDFVV